ncbi:hypothetical protein H5410_056775, partial [Solanum commersonii]
MAEEEKLRDNEEFRKKKANTRNDKRDQLHHLLVHINLETKGSVAQGGNWAPACSKCGRTHPSKYRDGSTCCFKCGQEGHFMEECPKNRQGLHLEELLSVVAEDQTTFIRSLVINSKIILQMLSLKLCEPFCVSTLVGESILVKQVYHNFVISINHKNTMADLVQLDLVDFDVLL